MKGPFKGLLLLFGLLSSKLHAGGVEQLFFSAEGRRIFVKLGESLSEGSRSIKSKVLATCPELPNKACVKWQLAISPQGNPNTYLPSIVSALNLITNNPGLAVGFVYNGITNFQGIPYQIEPGSQPPTPSLDQYGNKIIEGNFLISTLPPPDMTFPPGVVSTTVKYIVPNLETNTGDVRWGGIFLNPAYTPGQQYRLDLVIAHEAARILGVAPSATRNAVLFPSQASQYLGALQLAKDDLSWLEEIYPASGISTSLGSVSGEVINGNDGSKVYGAHVELIPLSKVQSFAQSADRKLADVGAFTREDGKFKIPNVPPGDYVMLFEAIKNVPLDKSLWDDWIFVNGSPTAFVTEFYSGAQRESNHETSSSFSPRLIYGAAVLTVQAGQETSNVQIVTEADQLNAPAIVATGSSNEHLVDWPDISDRLKELNQTQDTASDGSAGGGGCSLHVSEALEDPARGPIIIFVLVLLTLSVWGLRKESYRSEFHRS